MNGKKVLVPKYNVIKPSGKSDGKPLFLDMSKTEAQRIVDELYPGSVLEEIPSTFPGVFTRLGNFFISIFRPAKKEGT